jgi:hypothetical protein
MPDQQKRLVKKRFTGVQLFWAEISLSGISRTQQHRRSAHIGCAWICDVWLCMITADGY